MKALLIAAAACAALSTVPAMAATTHRPLERVQVIPLDPTEAQVALPSDGQSAMFQTNWARDQVNQDPALISALEAQGMSLDRVIDLGRYSDGQVDIYVSG